MLDQLALQGGALLIVGYVVQHHIKRTDKLIERNTEAFHRIANTIEACPHATRRDR